MRYVILQRSQEIPAAGAPDWEHHPDRDAQLGGGLQVGGVRQGGGGAARAHLLHLLPGQVHLQRRVMHREGERVGRQI